MDPIRKEIQPSTSRPSSPQKPHNRQDTVQLHLVNEMNELLTYVNTNVNNIN